MGGQAKFLYFWWDVCQKKKKVSGASHQNLPPIQSSVAYSTGAGLGVNLTGYEALLWGRLMHGYGAVFLCSLDWGMWSTLSGLTIVLWACGSISGWHLYAASGPNLSVVD